MKKLMYHKQYVSVGDESWTPTNFWECDYLVYEEPKDEIIKIFSTFEQAYRAIAQGAIRRAHTTTTLFGKPQIKICYGTLYRDNCLMTARNFKGIATKTCYEDTNRKWTIKDLSQYLSAEQFADWLKDHGITQAGSL